MEIGIIGLGLIGGSLAKAIKKKDKLIKIIAFDLDKFQLDTALSDKNIDISVFKIDESFQNCDIIFVCTPVDITIQVIMELKSFIREDCLITDVSSTKEEITKKVLAIQNINFIGGHPMAGSEKTGYENSSDILFENAFYIVTPFENIRNAHIELLKDIINLIGGIYIEVSPKEHDVAVAMISHIPHILASSLVNFVSKNDSPDHLLKTIAAGGFKDITRIASASGTLWNSIIKSNKDTILKNYRKFIDEQLEILELIEAENNEKIITYIEEGKRYRDSIQNLPNYMKAYNISVDVPDQPNVIGIVASKLGAENINIKNIGINHNREDSIFALTITFYDEPSMVQAVDLLCSSNYLVKVL